MFCLLAAALSFGEVQVEEIHGVKVSDPYRALEDANSEVTKQWVQEQNSRTFDYLKQIPQRDAIRKRLETIWNHEKYGFFGNRSGRYFFWKNTGLQNQFVLYVMDRLGGTPELLLDPNLLSEDGTVSVTFTYLSKDAKRLAYALSSKGSDWLEIKVRDVESKKDLSDRLEWVKISTVAWLPNGSGFYYCRYDEPPSEAKYAAINQNHKIYLHRLGNPQEKDELIYTRPDHKEWYLFPFVTDDGKYLIIKANQGTDPNDAIFYKELSSEGPIKELIPDLKNGYTFVGNEGTTFWFMTGWNAPRRRLMSLDIKQMEWKEVIGQKDEILTDIELVGERFVANYLKDAHTVIQFYKLDGSFEKELSLPSIGSAGGFSGKREDLETFYHFASYTQPSTIYRYDFTTGESKEIFRPSVPISCDDYETSQVFYTSRDGTKIPMCITHKKGLKYDGNNPVYLYAYGGFGHSMTPGFYVSIIPWLEMGGVFAVPNIRGGGEYGKEWHNAGRLKNKQNSFDDFIAAAE